MMLLCVCVFLSVLIPLKSKFRIDVFQKDCIERKLKLSFRILYVCVYLDIFYWLRLRCKFVTTLIFGLNVDVHKFLFLVRFFRCCC